MRARTRNAASGRPTGPSLLAGAAAAALAVAVLAGCGSAAPASPPPQSSAKGTTVAACQHTGAYKLVPSVNGSYPLLPVSPRGADATPRVRLVSARPAADPATVDLSLIADDPALGGPKEFPGLTVGETAEYAGYTVRVTAICEGEVWFDLTARP
ncbi:hypothetical protein SA2016_3112 [Sinomonas atrocyanea]|uniref:Lipoprotein n=1 Tax=Sinomonas atrocyanea TaxID=37927 RepID=A0A127A3M7_9MICC|nr:hypothetical protein [Sinomonas atrocyanea]AMM33777.1 hypothetical protein SA2016_3112 [Sinomonas atrocyanea]GEB64351.1 hypothetical protein SAT01_17990 [Sinomonas atrocyanea]GGG71027.1 hypothetical protein GCM10007172_24100 [Sinomonas atrocyanea]